MPHRSPHECNKQAEGFSEPARPALCPAEHCGQRRAPPASHALSILTRSRPRPASPTPLPWDLRPWRPCAALKGDILVVSYLHDVAARPQLRVLSTGALVKDIPLPGLGSVSGFSGNRKSTEMFFSYTSACEDPEHLP